MPIYEFRCPTCDAVFDAYLPFSESDKPVNCPDCKESAQKQFPAPYIIWGQGWAKPMNWGWKKKSVLYQDGHWAEKDHNARYEDGLLGK